jgi:two-component system, NtrC family, sensor kinase
MNRNEMKVEGYHRSVSRNMFLTIIIVSITPMILVSAIILYQFHRSYTEKVHAHLGTLVKKHKQNIDGFLNEKLADISFLADTFTFEELSNKSFLEDRLHSLQKDYGGVFVDLGVINDRGVQVAYAGPFRLGKALYSEAEWFKEAQRKKAVISDVFLGLRGLPHFIVAVKDDYMGQTWILRATIDFGAFNDLVQNIRIGQTGFAYILNRDGEFQTKTVLDVLPSRGPCAEFVSNGEGFNKGICITTKDDENGIENIYVTGSLKRGGWLLVFRQKSSDAFSDFHQAVRVSLVIMVMGGLGIISMASVFSKKMAHRIQQADQEKELMNEQIVETGKLASVGELAAGIAHEINNPVAIMVEEAGWIEDLLEEETFEDGENIKEFRRALEQIRNQGRRCKEITHKLLSFARKTDSTIQEVQIKDVIEELISLSSQRAKFSNVAITSDIENDLPALQISQTEIQQVLLNLINNALDAMEKKGGALDVRAKRKNGSIDINVEDTGPGIPEANIGRIFDPFYTTKPVGKGTGLGLSICYGIIKKMGGEIQVRSTIGVGTSFRVRIPLPKNNQNNGAVER